jgi:hypothetical protein
MMRFVSRSSVSANAPMEVLQVLRDRMHELLEASTEDTETLARLTWGISEVDIAIARRLAEGES